jgi:hypothetical protein
LKWLELRNLKYFKLHPDRFKGEEIKRMDLICLSLNPYENPGNASKEN